MIEKGDRLDLIQHENVSIKNKNNRKIFAKQSKDFHDGNL
jgi:hypothetical protein